MTAFPWNPTARQLRQFGSAAAVALPLFTWLWTRAAVPTLAAAGAGVVVALVGLLWPRSLKPFFLGLTLAAWPISLVVQKVLLGIVFFCMIVPLGLLLRRLRPDPMQRRFDPTATTYWQPKQPPKDAAGYFRRW